MPSYILAWCFLCVQLPGRFATVFSGFTRSLCSFTTSSCFAMPTGRTVSSRQHPNRRLSCRNWSYAGRLNCLCCATFPVCFYYMLQRLSIPDLLILEISDNLTAEVNVGKLTRTSGSVREIISSAITVYHWLHIWATPAFSSVSCAFLLYCW